MVIRARGGVGRIRRATIVAAAILASARAQAASPSFVLSLPSATLPGIPATAGDILGPATSPAPGPLAPPLVGVPAAALGLVPGDVITSIHFSAPPTAGFGVQILFSVDGASTGTPLVPPPANLSCEAPAQGLGDVLLSQPYGPLIAPNVLALDGNGLADSACAPTGGPGLGLSEPSSDDLSALEMCAPQFVFSNGVLTQPVYFTLAPGSPTLSALPAGASDVLIASPPGFLSPAVSLFTATTLVLAACTPGAGAPACDEIDALAFLSPPPAAPLFSLAPGSPSLGLCGFTPGDLIYSGFPTCGLSIAAASLGLTATDNVDALAVMTDVDSDLVADGCDNCFLVANNDQADLDADGVGDACDGVFNCPPAAELGCAAAGTALLGIKDTNEDGAGPGDKLFWKWLRGPATMQSDFGDPTTTTDYALCFYDGSGALALELNAFGGFQGWYTVSTKGYKFLDEYGSPDGIQKFTLSGGAAGRSKIRFKARDSMLPLTAATLPFDDSGDIVVQLHNSDNSNCWETTFPPASVRRNGESVFKAKPH